MNRYLFLLRHAEAEQDAVEGDINRALTPRGTASAVLVGESLRGRGERMQKIYSSTALRAAQTARAVCPYLACAEKDIVWRPELYLAAPGDLLAFLAAIPSRVQSMLLVGHNPGLQNLVTYLASAASLPAEKSMPTAAVAKLEMTQEWDSLRPECARLVYLIRP